MSETEAYRLGAQTASEDFAERQDGHYDLEYLRKLAQRWALREMFRLNADVPTAKLWEAAFIRGYQDTNSELLLTVVERVNG